MENASKALMIAGSILLALMITALLVKNFSDISSFQKTKLTEQEQEQIVEFNEQYTKYLNKYVYGTEVASLKNKYVSDGKVEVEVWPAGTILPTGIGQDIQYFKCTGIGYDETTGRVNKITFQKIEVNAATEDV